MTVSDKLIRAKEDYDAVYDKGYSDGAAQGGGGYDQGFAEGKQAEYDAFWDVFQDYGNRRNYNQAFYNTPEVGRGWTDEIFNPKYPIITSAEPNNNIFSFCAFTDTKVEIDLSASTASMNTFVYCRHLQTIRKVTLPTDENANVANMFLQCYALENIAFGGEIVQTGISFEWSTKLSRESITNIINALSSNVTNKTITLSRTPIRKAFETSVGANDGNTSAEWLNLVDTKRNWTISLV